MNLKKLMNTVAAIVSAGLMCFSQIPVMAAAKEAIPYSAEPSASGRTEISFNNDWLFYKGDVPGANQDTFQDSNWLYVNVPHSTIQYTPENYYQKDLGVYWYRRHFQTPDAVTEDRHVLLTFEGAMQTADVWLNNIKLGTHQGGYTEFSFDITEYLKSDGSENVLAVKLDTRPDETMAPGKTNPDFQYFGGLYRNVFVTVTNPVHITDAVSSGTAGGGGIFLTAPEVSEESATVKAKTEIINGSSDSVDVTVKTEIMDQDGGEAVATQTGTKTLAANSKESVDQSLIVENPRLWSVNTPELYKVRTTISMGDVICDRMETTYGIRKVEWKRDGCYINDERVELIGTNLHSETYMLGNAQSDDAIFAEIKRLREYGFNFIRMAHYPHAQAFYEACDRYGVAVLDCLAGWQQFKNTDAFKNNTYQQIREMVRANRNHPSIVAWEPSLNESSFNDAWAAQANAVTKEEYPQEGVSKAWTSGWKSWSKYDLGVGTPQANVVGDAAKNADKPVIVSEYGDWNMGGFNSTSRVTREPQHYSSAKGGDEGMLEQCDNIQSSLAYNRKQSGWYGASAYWQYSDYAGFDTEKLTYCGVVDVARIPKFSAYFYQSQTDPELDLSKYGIKSGPMVYIANTWASDSPNQVRVFSNCDKVELYLNDTLISSQEPDKTMWDPRGSYGDGDYKKQPSNTSGAEVSTEGLEHPPFTFDLSNDTPGEGTLKAVGYIGDEKRVEYIRSAPEAPSQITLQPENDEALKLDGSTAKLVWVDVRDVNGTVVNTANNEITFAAEGPGIVIGEKKVAVRGGQWAVWVRSKRGNGDITLTAAAEGLKSASLTIKTQAVEGLPAVPEGGDADETEFEFEEVQENIFLNKAATASSVNVARNGKEEKAEYANDGDENTKWCAKVTDGGADASVGPHWWQVDLGMEYEINQMELVFDKEAGYSYQIAVSNDPDFADYNAADHMSRTENGGRVTEEVGQVGRYVRIYLNCASSSAWPCLREVSGTGRVNNIAYQKEATAQRSANGSLPSLAVDGDAETFWNSGANGPCWWQVDLGDDYQVNTVTLSFEWGAEGIHHGFTLQGSMDGQTWSNIAEWSDLEESNVSATAVLEVNAEARYLRVNNLTAVKAGKAQWVEIEEFTATGQKLGEASRLDYGAKAYATSNAEDVTPEHGNDGNPQTFWAPSSEDANPFWQFDAAGLYKMNSVSLTWNTEGTHHYAVYSSTDGETWEKYADHMTDGKAGQTTIDAVAGIAKYIRIAVKAGTTEGFWINSSGRVLTPAPAATLISDTLGDVEASLGTQFADLNLPEDVEAVLENQSKTRLPVTWSETGYHASDSNPQTLTGTVQAIPGVNLAGNTTVTVNVRLISGSGDDEKADKTALLELLTEARVKHQAEYTSESWAAFEAALDAAQEEYTNTGSTQASVDKAVADLRGAIERLQKKTTDPGDDEKADKTALLELLTEARAKDQTEYTSESWTAFKAALDAAQAEYNCADSSKTSVAKAVSDLTEAMKKLVKAEAKSTNVKGYIHSGKKLRYQITRKASASGAGAVKVIFADKKQTKVTIPDKVKIGAYTYKVEIIAKDVFRGNRKLKNVKIGNNVKMIPDHAFSGCKVLTRVTIGKSVTKVGKNAFQNTSKLKQVVIKSKKIQSFGKNAFKNANSKAVIKVPKSKKARYRRLLKGTGQKKAMKIR